MKLFVLFEKDISIISLPFSELLNIDDTQLALSFVNDEINLEITEEFKPDVSDQEIEELAEIYNPNHGLGCITPISIQKKHRGNDNVESAMNMVKHFSEMKSANVSVKELDFGDSELSGYVITFR